MPYCFVYVIVKFDQIPVDRRLTLCAAALDEASSKLFIIIKIKYSVEWETHQNGII